SAVEHIQNLIENLLPVVFGSVGGSFVHQLVPLVPLGLQFVEERVVFFIQRKLGFADFLKQGGVVFARLFLGAQFFQMHVQFEDFLQEIGGHDLLFQVAGSARLFGRLFRLLFQFDAFEARQVFGTLDRIFQRAVGVVEHGTLFQAEGTLLGVGPRK